MHNAAARRAVQRDGYGVGSSSDAYNNHVDPSIASQTTECTIDEVVLDTSYGATLRQCVADARRELRHIDALLVRAVWECLLERHRQQQQQQHDVESPVTGDVVRALTVEQRQAQVRALLAPMDKMNSVAVRSPASRQPSRFMWRENKVSRSRRTRAQALLGAAAQHHATHSKPASSLALRCAAMEKVLAAGNVNTTQNVTTSAGRDKCKPSASPIKPSTQAVDNNDEVTSNHASDTSRNSNHTASLESVSLLVLRAARQRALLRLTLHVMRLVTHEARERRQEITLRYHYYLQRRILRRWCDYARRAHARRRRLMRKVVAKWSNYVENVKAMRACVLRLRAALQSRRQATLCCHKRRLAKCLERWRVRLAARCEQRAMTLQAERFVRQSARGRWQAAFDRYVCHGTNHEVLGAAQSTALRAGRTSPVRLVQPVQGRFVLARLWHVWHAKAQQRQDMRVAVQHRTRTLQRRLLTQLHRHIAHTTRDEDDSSHTDDSEKSKTAEAAQITSADSTTVQSATDKAQLLTTPCAPAVIRGPVMTVTVEPNWAAVMLPYKLCGVRRVAQCRLQRRLFERWRQRMQARMAARLNCQRICLRVMRCWLWRLALRSQARHERELLWCRWRVRYAARQAARDADAVCEGRLLHRVCVVWRNRLRSRQARAIAQQRECLRVWWARAALRVSRRVLRAQFALRVLQHWAARAETRRHMRRNTLIAETIGETVWLVWCFRRWHDRMRQQRRLRLSLDVLHDLQQEKLRRRCFTRWSLRVFGPHPPSLVDSHQASLL